MSPELKRTIATLIAADPSINPIERTTLFRALDGDMPEARTEDRMLTARAAAAYLGISTPTFWRLRRESCNPLLHPVEVKRGLYRYSQARLDAYRSKTIEPTMRLVP